MHAQKLTERRFIVICLKVGYNSLKGHGNKILVLISLPKYGLLRTKTSETPVVHWKVEEKIL